MGSQDLEMISSTGEEQAPLLDDTQEPDDEQDVPTQTTPTREPYCSAGFDGLLTSSYAAFCALFVSICGLLFGYDQGVISVILVERQFLNRFPQIVDDASTGAFSKGLLTAMIEVGALLGAFNQGWVADQFSRKRSIVAAATVFIFGSVLQTSAQTYGMLVLARFLGGVGIGMLSMVAPLYISEISPPEIRGSLLVLEELSIVIGVVVAFWITYATQYIDSEWAWRLPFLLQIIPGLLLGVGINFLPFSPRWLVWQGRDEEALASLSKLRHLSSQDKRVRQEWMDIRAEVKLHQDLSAKRHPELQKQSQLLRRELTAWLHLFKAGCWRRTQVGIGVMFFQQFVGINAVIYYAPELLALLGLDHNMQLIMTGVVNMAQLVGVMSSLWTMDRVGRRSLLLVGSTLMFLSHFLIAITVNEYSNNWQAHRTAGWACVSLLLFYMLTFGATWGPVPWALPSEIFPSSYRAKGVAISSCSNWLNNSIIGLVTPTLMQRSGWGAYAFFAVFCLLSGIWTYMLVPETAGKTLEQMDHVFGDVSTEEENLHRKQILRQLRTTSTAS